MALEVMGSTPTTHPIEKALASARAFSVKFVPAKRVKLPPARESLASEPEIRLRRVENGFHFTSCEAGYFTMRDSALFHIRRKANISLEKHPIL